MKSADTFCNRTTTAGELCFPCLALLEQVGRERVRGDHPQTPQTRSASLYTIATTTTTRCWPWRCPAGNEMNASLLPWIINCVPHHGQKKERKGGSQTKYGSLRVALQERLSLSSYDILLMSALHSPLPIHVACTTPSSALAAHRSSAAESTHFLCAQQEDCRSSGKFPPPCHAMPFPSGLALNLRLMCPLHGTIASNWQRLGVMLLKN